MIRKEGLPSRTWIGLSFVVELIVGSLLRLTDANVGWRTLSTPPTFFREQFDGLEVSLHDTPPHWKKKLKIENKKYERCELPLTMGL